MKEELEDAETDDCEEDDEDAEEEDDDSDELDVSSDGHERKHVRYP